MPQKSSAATKKRGKLFNIDSQHLVDLASLGSQSLAEVANIVSQSLAKADTNTCSLSPGSHDPKAAKYIVRNGRFCPAPAYHASEFIDANENYPLDDGRVGEISPEGPAGDVEVSNGGGLAVAATAAISATPAAGYLNPPFMKTAPKIKSFRKINLHCDDPCVELGFFF